MIQNQMINGSYTKTLLYETSGTTVGEITITLNDSILNYDLIEIEYLCVDVIASSIYRVEDFPVGSITTARQKSYETSPAFYISSSYTGAYRRIMRPLNTIDRLYFSAIMSAGSGNSYATPIKIYGIKLTIPMEEI